MIENQKDFKGNQEHLNVLLKALEAKNMAIWSEYIKTIESEIDLRGVNLSNRDLWRVDFSRTNLWGANLSHCNLKAAYFRRANLYEANLEGADLYDADLWGVNLRRANLSKTNLSKAYLRRANLSKTHVRGADLKEADLSEADLRRADFRGADLTEANLRATKLRGAYMSKASLHKSNLRRANLSKVELGEADLSEAHLRGANLSETNLQGADLRGTDLHSIHLYLSNLEDVKLGDNLIYIKLKEDWTVNEFSAFFALLNKIFNFSYAIEDLLEQDRERDDMTKIVESVVTDNFTYPEKDQLRIEKMIMHSCGGALLQGAVPAIKSTGDFFRDYGGVENETIEVLENKIPITQKIEILEKRINISDDDSRQLKAYYKKLLSELLDINKENKIKTIST